MSTPPDALANDQKRMLRAALVYAAHRNPVLGVWQREARGLVPPRLAPTTHQMAHRVLRGRGTYAQQQAVRVTLMAYATAQSMRIDAYRSPRVEPLHGLDIGQALRTISAKKPLEVGEDPVGTMVARFDALWRAVHAYHGDPERIQKTVTKLCQCDSFYGGGLSYVRLANDLSVVMGDDPEESKAITQRWMQNRLGLHGFAGRSAA
ncbi:hypothetical protein AB0M72_06820 [Nocardiopsis dassonvillei]